jgi:hypothetical protein
VVSARQTGVTTTNLNTVIIVRLANIGNEPAGLKSPVTFSIAKLPRGVKVLDVQPQLTDKAAVGEYGWECNAVSCTLRQRTDSGVQAGLIPTGSSVRADVRVNYAADAELFIPSSDYLANAKALADKVDTAGLQALDRTVPHILFRGTTAGDK